jgi:hypothetical protein
MPAKLEIIKATKKNMPALPTNWLKKYIANAPACYASTSDFKTDSYGLIHFQEQSLRGMV